MIRTCPAFDAISAIARLRGHCSTPPSVLSNRWVFPGCGRRLRRSPTFGRSDGSTRAIAEAPARSKWISVSEPSGSTSLIVTATPSAGSAATAKCSGRIPSTPLPALAQRAAALRAKRHRRAALRKHHALPAPLDGEEIHRRRADEARHELVGRPLIDRLRRVVLLHRAALQHHDAVGHGHGLDLIVGDEDHRGLQLLRQRLDFGAHLPAQLCIEIGKRLVEQERLRIAHDGASHRHALALAAGQFLRLAVEIGLDMQQRRGALHPRVDLGLRRAPQLERKGHVVVDAHMRIERVVLEHHGDIALRRRDAVDALVADIDFARRDRLEPGDDPEQRGLAAAGRADKDDELVICDFEVEIGDHGKVAVALDEIADRDRGHDCQSSASTGLISSPLAKRAKFSGKLERPNSPSTRTRYSSL